MRASRLVEDGGSAVRAAALVLALALSGCLHIEGRPPAGFAPPPMPEYNAVPPQSPEPGAIYAANHGFAGWAEDDRARRVGDIVTIVLVERTDAVKAAAANTGRKTALSLSLPKAKPFSSLPVGLFQGAADYSFNGQGAATQSNQLRGEITVAVVGVRPGGILVVRGQKVVRLNRGDEYVNITGLVRMADIGPDNRVPSTRVADARIAYAGTGEIAAQSRQGWVMRLLNFFTPF